jgi:hypothetical protein
MVAEPLFSPGLAVALMTFRRALRSIGEMMSASGTINTPITASIQNTSIGEQSICVCSVRPTQAIA